MKQENKTSYAFIRSSTIDVTDSNKCAVPKDEFRMIDFSNAVGAQFKDLVHNVKPFLHFQILQPINQDQREKAINYFNENGKIYATYTDMDDILLYVGCTQNVYIKSGSMDVSDEDLKNLLPQAAHWYRFYGDKEDKLE